LIERPRPLHCPIAALRETIGQLRDDLITETFAIAGL
jgi:hypothetical protein